MTASDNPQNSISYLLWNQEVIPSKILFFASVLREKVRLCDQYYSVLLTFSETYFRFYKTILQQHLRRIKCHRISTTHKTACQFKSYEYSFLDLPDLNCSCENNIEMENYTCLHCTKFSELTFLQKIQVIEPNILMKSCGNITRLLSVGLNSLCN